MRTRFLDYKTSQEKQYQRMATDTKMLGMTVKPPVILSCAYKDGHPKNLNDHPSF